MNEDQPIICDSCGEVTNDWDWSGFHHRFCQQCLDALDAEDEAQNRGDYEYHQRYDQDSNPSYRSAMIEAGRGRLLK
jgi:hypothetical protein